MWGGDACVARREQGVSSQDQDAGDASVPSPLCPTPAPAECKKPISERCPQGVSLLAFSMMMMVFRAHTTRRAAAKQGDGVTLDGKIGLFSHRGKLISGQANVYLDHAVALGAGQMVVMRPAAHAIVMGAIGELDTIQYPHAEERSEEHTSE